MEAFWYVMTILGTPELWAVLSLGLLALYLALKHAAPENPLFKRHKTALRKFLIVFIPSLSAVLLITLGIKSLWYVPRPCIPCTEISLECNPYCDADSSFPSGHSATIFAVFSSVYLSARKKRLLPVFIIPVMVSVSRVALGVHTLTDVFGGAILGLFIPILVSVIAQKKHKLK
ncbi:MAG: phosphatase PAP2 family protein [Candidatus Aenigmatarchaeota archaeon]